jgi:hypothetical protein
MDWENLPDRTGLFSNVVPVIESLLPNGGEDKRPLPPYVKIFIP